MYLSGAFNGGSLHEIPQGNKQKKATTGHN